MRRHPKSGAYFKVLGVRMLLVKAAAATLQRGGAPERRRIAL